MRWYVFLSFYFMLIVAGFSQGTKKYSFKVVNQPLPVVLDSISEKTNFFFSYNSQILPKGSLYTLSMQNVTVDEYLEALFVGTGITYDFYEDQIILKRNPSVNKVQPGDFFIIEGKVTEKSTGGPLPGVNIFLNGTTIGKVSDLDGNYRIENIPVGSYQVVFSYVGFKKIMYNFTVDKTGKMVINAILEEDLVELEAVTVNSDSTLKFKYQTKSMKRFQQELIGKTAFARECNILNEDAISIWTDEEENDLLKVNADKPLKIENNALGYVLYYDIELFESTTEKIRSFANIRFEELDHANWKEKRTWKKNREKAYKGSLRHFLKSLINNTYLEDGFKVYEVEALDKLTGDNLLPLSREEILKPTDDPLKFEIYFDDYIYVVYEGDVESSEYYLDLENRIYSAQEFDLEAFLFAATKRPEYQRSVMKILEETIEVDINGHIIKPLSVSTYGYWSWEKLGDLVPIDYKLK